MSDTEPTSNRQDDENAQPTRGLGIRNITSTVQPEGVERTKPPTFTELQGVSVPIPFYLRTDTTLQSIEDSRIDSADLESASPFSRHQAYLPGRDQVTPDPSTPMPGSKLVKNYLANKLKPFFGQLNLPSPTPNTQQETVYTQARPAARRVNSNRPPPPTPPEPIMDAQLSMPTLPFFHQTSIPALIEKYREERAMNPEAFDHQTQVIKENLVRAKVERGGSSELFHNEYTVELASRLDAQAADAWGQPRQHEQEEYVESDDEQEEEDDEHDNVADQGATGHHGRFAPMNLDNYTAETSTATNDDGEKTPIASQPLNLEQDAAEQILFNEEKLLPVKDLKISDHVNHISKSGKIRYQNKLVRETSDNGSKLTLKTLIEIVQVIDTERKASDKNKGKSRAADDKETQAATPFTSAHDNDLATNPAAMRADTEPSKLHIDIDKLTFASTGHTAEHAIADTLRHVAATEGIDDAFAKHLEDIAAQLGADKHAAE